MNAKELSKRMKDFYSRWGTEDSRDENQIFISFRRAMLQAFRHIDDIISDSQKEIFAYAFGVERTYERRSVSGLHENTLFVTLRDANSHMEFYKIIEAILNLSFKASFHFQNTFDKVKQILELQPVNINIEKFIDDTVVVTKKGEELLDEKIVKKALSFLDEKSNTHYVDALNEYQKSTKQSHIKSCEQLRRTIEEYLKYKLGNTKNLNNNVQELLKKLEEKGINKEIRNLVQKDIDYLDKYFNENSKHGDGEIGEAENEFLIYQVGLLLRLVDEALK